jgi:hypothetical protein
VNFAQEGTVMPRVFIPFFLIALVGELAAQDQPPVPSIRTGARIRVTTHDRARYEGTVGSWSRDTLTLERRGVVTRLPRPVLDSIWMKRSPTTGAAIGSVIGFVPSFVFFFWLIGSYCGWDGPDDCGGVGTLDAAGTATLISLAPATVGALIGVVVNSGWRRVSPVYPPAQGANTMPRTLFVRASITF